MFYVQPAPLGGVLGSKVSFGKKSHFGSKWPIIAICIIFFKIDFLKIPKWANFVLLKSASLHIIIFTNQEKTSVTLFQVWIHVPATCDWLHLVGLENKYRRLVTLSGRLQPNIERCQMLFKTQTGGRRWKETLTSSDRDLKQLDWRFFNSSSLSGPKIKSRARFKILFKTQ